MRGQICRADRRELGWFDDSAAEIASPALGLAKVWRTREAGRPGISRKTLAGWANRRRRLGAFVCLLVLFLTGCEIEDQLEIREDGSGTYRARITVEKVAGHVLDRIEAQAERDGFRIIDKGETFTQRFVVLRKDFTDIATLSGSQSNFELTIDRPSMFRRRYHLRITVASVTSAQFDRRFVITMPAEVKSTTAGADDGPRVTWFCANGGTIEIVAEGRAFPVPPMDAWIVVGIAAGIAVVLAGSIRLLRGRKTRVAMPAPVAETACTTCSTPLSPESRYCPSCGDRVLSL